MKACIHRGTHEIGGTCVEIEAQGKRLVLDVGLPLNADDPDNIPLPPVKGFVNADPSLLGVIISHPHQDHYGLAKRLPRSTRFLLGEAAERILKAAVPFSPGAAVFENVMHLHHEIPINLGPFTITPYLVDHSAYDSYAVLIEADGKRLFYSGDFRGHGRKGKLLDAMLKRPPQNVDVLLLEGTVVGQEENRASQTEAGLEPEMEQIIKSTQGMVLVSCSGQNIDRLVTIFKATRKTGRQLIIDGYTAHVLKSTGNKNLPQADWRGVRVFWPNYLRVKIKQTEQFHLVNELKGYRIFPEKLPVEAGKSVMLFRSSMISDLERVPDCLTDASLIYSMWDGYLKDESSKRFLAWLEKHHIPLHHCHTSGHATVEDLKKLAVAIAPRQVVPIHTFNPGRFSTLFKNVSLKEDGKWWDVRLERRTSMTPAGKKRDYRIGRIHGTPTPGYKKGEKTKRKAEEREMETNLFMAGRLRIWESNTDKRMLRVIGYEIPLPPHVGKRRHCLDLLAYDGQHRPYLIELKRAGAKVKPDAVIEQITDYAERFEKIRKKIEREIQDILLWPEFRFSDNPVLAILAPKGFYERYREAWKEKADKDVRLYYLCGSPSTILKRKGGIVDIRIIRQRRKAHAAQESSATLTSA